MKAPWAAEDAAGPAVAVLDPEERDEFDPAEADEHDEPDDVDDAPAPDPVPSHTTQPVRKRRIPPAAQIVPMTPEHFDELTSPFFQRDVNPDDPWVLDTYRRELSDPRRRYLVVIDANQKVVGVAGMFTASGHAEITTVGVATAARQQGIGCRLVDALLTAARKAGVMDVHAEIPTDDTPAYSLFEHAGFHPRTATVRAGAFGNEHIVMRRAL